MIDLDTLCDAVSTALAHKTLDTVRRGLPRRLITDAEREALCAAAGTEIPAAHRRMAEKGEALKAAGLRELIPLMFAGEAEIAGLRILEAAFGSAPPAPGPSVPSELVDAVLRAHVAMTKERPS